MTTPKSVTEVASAMLAELTTTKETSAAELARVRRIEAEVPDARLCEGEWVSSETRRMVDVELEIVRAGCEPRHDDPQAVYARPRFRLGETSIRCSREYQVAVSVPGRVSETPDWEARMRADGLAESVLRSTRELLDGLDTRARGERPRSDARDGSESCSQGKKPR